MAEPKGYTRAKTFRFLLQHIANKQKNADEEIRY